MLNDFLRRSNKTLVAIMLGASALILQACGGGGTSSDTGLRTGELAILPATSTVFAGNPFTFTIAGGTAPYHLQSSEPALLPLNLTTSSNTYTVVPGNPAVIDAGLPPEAYPIRTVNVTVRDNGGRTAQASVAVGQNFLLGFDVTISSISACGQTGGTGAAVSVSACAGFESRIDIRPFSGGLFRPNRRVRFSVLFGPLAYIQDDNVTLASTYTTVTDSFGRTFARFVPASNALTQFVGIRLTDVDSGSYRDVVITLLSAPTGPLTATPATLPVIAGGTTSQCGQGQANVLITGGVPPYRAVTTAPLSVLISPSDIPASGGVLNVFYGGGLPPNCGSGSIVITDAVGASVTVTASSAPGTVAPTQPLTVSPTSFCFTAAGQTGTAIALGGNATKVVNSANTAIATAALATNTVTITAGAALGTTTVNVNDGASSVSINVTRAAVCP
ncbi:MAG: hypothetical protein JNM76_00135 [Betaproteobacteria bacterium]|nr:hypothetical protein [Betaproteobacteria bacterium]